MEDPTPYRVSPRPLTLESRTRTDTFRYAGGILIQFKNYQFELAEFPMRHRYSREDWKTLVAIEAEITRLEQQTYPEGLKE